MESNLSEQESLKVIRTMVQKARSNMSEGSIFYLLWGWAVLSACVIQYLLLEVFSYENHWIAWPVLMFGAGIASMIIGRRESRKQRYVTFVDNVMVYLWGGFVIYLFIVLGMATHIGWAYSYILIIGLYGLGTFVSGGVIKFRPLIIGGIISLLLAFSAIFATGFLNEFKYVLLMLSFSIIASYLVPGYMLRAKRESNAS